MSVAGLDIGTSGCKIVVYDLEGNIKAACSHSYKEEGADGYREIDPATVLPGVKACIKNVSKELDDPIRALAVGTLGESVVCMDEDGKILGKSMVTGDKRGILEVEEILQKVSREEIMDITGIPASEMYSLPKLLWMNKHTDMIKRAKYIFTYEDYIGYYLTGNRKISHSSASRTMALDIEQKVWSEKLLEIAGISKEQMSVPVSAGTIVGQVLPEIAEELGLSPEMKVVAGGHDQECAALGAGVVTSGIGEDGHGTCEVLNLMLGEPLRTKAMIETDMACVPGMIPGTYMTNMEITTCGILMNWSRDCMFEGIHRRCKETGENFFAYMDRKATGIKTELAGAASVWLVRTPRYQL
ncbi:MAG: FGGY-family carbohydrate kinase [Muricomes sp.]